MGDLNSTPNPKVDRLPTKKHNSPENKLLKILKYHNFYDTFRLFHPSSIKFTYTHNNSASRIDQIWTNIHITLLDYADILQNPFTTSDHSIISLETTIIINKPTNTEIHTRTSFKWNSAQTNQIEQYQHHTEQNLIRLLTPIKEITNTNDLNTIWNQIKKAINKATLKFISYKKIKTNSNLQDQQKPNLSPLYNQLKNIISIKNLATNTDISSAYNSYIGKYLNNTLLPRSYQNFLEANPNPNTIPILLKSEIKNLKILIQKEKKDQTLLEIQNKLQERNNNFTQNPKLFFRKTLEKPNNSINLN